MVLLNYATLDLRECLVSFNLFLDATSYIIDLNFDILSRLLPLGQREIENQR